ncbi:MAG: hypothetical protein WB661_07175 [Candidatus Bathyarchaeia archaeon]
MQPTRIELTLTNTKNTVRASQNTQLLFVSVGCRVHGGTAPVTGILVGQKPAVVADLEAHEKDIFFPARI